MEKGILEKRFQNLCSQLLLEQNTAGFWTGQLSSSALSTAVAIVALKINGDAEDEARIESGYHWLCATINVDGGFGDTPGSKSNVSTSLLSYAAIYYCQPAKEDENPVLRRIENYLTSRHISLQAETVTSSILQFYGKDYTFSVPILSMLTVCGVLPMEACNRIPRLPFELSLFPASWYRFFNLQVVSYAIPALIGVGIYIHSKRNRGFWPFRHIRNTCIRPSIRKLERLMPESGGFLEAIPLTGFVAMCLLASNYGDNKVAISGITFLRSQLREDGSWPIDTDLSTWVTTLSIKALGPRLKETLLQDQIRLLKKHLLFIQYKEKHPFNGAKPGGWGWTNYSGSVPDADDTPGAILALLEMYNGTEDEREAIVNGCFWLTEVQNSDGGFPTFCKGWGRLPFDSSCADLTGHALVALLTSVEKFGKTIPFETHRLFYRSAIRAANYLRKHQADDGSWNPLWFGNQATIDQKNPVYGTSKVVIYLEDALLNKCVHGSIKEQLEAMIRSGQRYLVSRQNNDGSWSGQLHIPGTIEETSLAVSALVNFNKEACQRGLEWLNKESQTFPLKANPIGLYFAAIWYDEKLYPLIYHIEALRRFLESNTIGSKEL